ncbi:MAG: hypothetical protein EOP48_17040 [Sphingobacteriales bacterium]|nr:MAG: hypothetical protein EOP48_17040 [Sphingobacteriales bacterium]
MKHWTYIFLVSLISCNDPQQEVERNDLLPSATSTTLTDTNTQSNDELCWIGTVDGTIPVFVHYKQDSSLILGEITYLNTKDRQPIPLLGTIDDDGSYRLLEFEKSGNITGIITGFPKGELFAGRWFSPKTRKGLPLELVKKDTSVSSPPASTKYQDIFGQYHYQYSEAGYQGDFEITQLPNSKAIFSLISVTGEPARNLAQIDEDTINLSTTQFLYKLPGTEDCEFRVQFYKGFAVINYTRGFCEGQFGMNATVDGIFLKTK